MPDYHSGPSHAMPRARRWRRPHPIRAGLGAPLEPETLQARGRGESAQERVANALQAEVRALAAAIGKDV